MAHDENYYIIDAIRKRNMTLTDKALTLMSLVRTYRPTYNNVYYEEYSMQADIGFIQKIMEDEQFRFTITPLGGKVKKEERIRSLIPLFEQGRVYIPDKMMRANEEGVLEDLTQVFIRQEYLPFPYSTNDDLLDALSRITDQKVDIRPPAEERFQEADYIICDNDYDY
jgi:phage terminase large subunit-like protein